MNTQAPESPEDKNPTIAAELEALKRTADVVTVPVEPERLRAIVADEAADPELRRCAYELLSARSTISLLVACGCSSTRSDEFDGDGRRVGEAKL